MRINLRLRKIIRDLWGNKTRTLLVVLTISLGVFSVATISRTWLILSRELAASYKAINPASARLLTNNQQFNEDLVDVIRNMPEVEEAEGLRSERARVQIGPNKWRTLKLVALDTETVNKINKIYIEQGQWPPPDQTMLVERSAMSLLKANVGETVVIEMPDGKLREITISGLVHHLHQLPSSFTLLAIAYVTPETLEHLNGWRNYNELEVGVAENRLDEAHIADVVAQVTDEMEAGGLFVTRKEIPEPGKHPLDNVIQVILLILGLLSVMALLLSCFLVINTISALLIQQVQQIGTLKAIGARSETIMAIYLTAIVVFSCLALFISVPLGTIGGYLFSSFLAGLMNIDIASFYFPPWIYALDILAGLFVPVIAALYPIIAGTNITVREAISQTGANTSSFGTSWFDRQFERMRFLPTSLLYALRNMFRRKTRLALTLTTLSLAGAIFMSVLNVRTSLLVTIEDIVAYWQEDLLINFVTPERVAKARREALSIPGVAEVQGRTVEFGFRIRPDGVESAQTINIFGVQMPTDLLEPTVLEGRWLHPDDQNVIVINIDLLVEEPDIAVGDELVLKIDGRETTWTVAGLVTGQVVGGNTIMAPIAYANYDYLAKITGKVGRADRVLIKANRHDETTQTELERALEEQFKRVGLTAQSTILNSDARGALLNVFGILLSLLLFMTLLFAAVGGLGLMSMMSLSVLERTKEIGIIRVLGGANRAIRQIVIVEGVFIGILSWFFGLILAFPLSKFLDDAIGLTFIHVPLEYRFSISGVLLWLILVIILSAIASFLPAQNASRFSVRETLAYE